MKKADQQLSPVELERDTRLESLRKELMSGDTLREEQALRHLKNLPPDAIYHLIRLDTARHLNLFGWSFTLLLAVFLSVFLLLFRSSLGFSLFIAALMTGMTLFVVRHPLLGTEKRRLHRALGEIVPVWSGRESLEIVLDLCGPVHDPNNLWRDYPVETRRSLRTAIYRLLPEMDEALFRSLDASRISALLRPLTVEAFVDTHLMLRIMETIARFADPREDSEYRRTLRMLARAEVITPNMQQVRAEARAALTELDRRKALAQEAASLLRGSQSPPPNGSELLRSAGSLNHAPEQLLRPSSEDRP